MAALTTLATVKAHLRIDGSDEDTSLAIYIDAAEQYVNEWCDKRDTPFLTLPPVVAAAVLLIVGDLYENREGQSTVQIFENKTVTRLLTQQRDFSNG
ncbi:head-tail connector protein [Collimonas fungivorans]|uniref:Phage gp6-like head-tail connector protein n=1 Tax=Collimonas fungivorans (strain Ter331) TaxID=1005048 RepID=G0AAH4_COLFT|nr:head-tail connector protein [Collimonas fungivorans]AEK63188.1 hypothetical protein CFU_3364 [Collimonas fungivorans Ter331]